MFTYEDWANLSPDFLDVTKVSNEDLFKVIFDEFLDRGYEPSDIPMTAHGYADIYDGVPTPTLLVMKDQNLDACDLLEEIYESIFEFCGYASSRVYGTSMPTKVTYTGTAYVVQSIGRLDEGFPDLASALDYCLTSITD